MGETVLLGGPLLLCSRDAVEALLLLLLPPPAPLEELAVPAALPPADPPLEGMLSSPLIGPWIARPRALWLGDDTVDRKLIWLTLDGEEAAVRKELSENIE